MHGGNNDRHNNDYDDDDSTILEDSLKCIDNGVTYKTNPNQRINTIRQVESAELCRELCAENTECLYWTWVNKRNNKKCKLKAGILTTGFRRQRSKAVSGTMLNNCRPNSETTTPSNSNILTR
jgi:hypothetical protein